METFSDYSRKWGCDGRRGPRLAGKIGKGKLMLFCSSVIPFTFLLWPSRTLHFELLMLYAVAVAAWSATWSQTLSELMESVPVSRRGFFSGLNEASFMSGFTIGPMIAGLLWERLGHNAPLYASSLISVMSVPTALLLKRSLHAPQDSHKPT